MHIPGWVLLAYFSVLWIVVMWKGQDFLAEPLGKKLFIAFGVVLPWALFIILPHVT